MAQKLQETEEKRKRALLVSISDGKKAAKPEAPQPETGENAPTEESGAGDFGEAPESDVGRELRGLAETLELEIVGHEIIRIRERQPRFGMGSGKAEELSEKAKALEADCLVFDWDPSPSQQRNWETLAGIPVVDRQELIIRIFSQRAATREADLQVQLAQLNYRLPRLTHKYIDLSRQRGGRYGTKGSGETLLETDRRQIEQRIFKLEKEIGQVVKQRQVQRRQRERQRVPVCAIVGYTNAGKSSLLNALTGASVLVEDKLFATLDATTRRFEPVPGTVALLTDTVGFIRRLPHSLIKAFRSTLEEASHASLLLHVLDVSDREIDECFQTTVSVLDDLGAGEIPVVTVLNKIDRLDKAQRDTVLPQFLGSGRFPESIAVSVKDGIGLKELKSMIAEKLNEIALGRNTPWADKAAMNGETY
ncbi:MAG: GTPase HflX [Treponema sp.]|nr:GTPase HflX [Treponema sp.]